MSGPEQELRAQANALYELARRNADSSEGLLYLLHAAECEQQADELLIERREFSGAHTIDDRSSDERERDDH